MHDMSYITGGIDRVAAGGHLAEKGCDGIVFIFQFALNICLGPLQFLQFTGEFLDCLFTVFISAFQL